MLLALSSALAIALAGAPEIPAVSASPDQDGAKLRRIFTKGEKGEYEFKSMITAESRNQIITTFIPEQIQFAYKFTFDVTDIKTDGIAQMRYKRPSMSQTQDTSSGLKTTVEKVNFDLQLAVSQVNELIEIKDLSPKKDGGKGSLRAVWPTASSATQVGGVLGEFVSEIHRLALFIGSIDSALDFSPKLPYDESTAVGETWKRTVGYSPQKASGGGAKMSVQRLDYTYTYKGLVDSGGKKVQRIEADLTLDTDLAAFIHEAYGLKPTQTGLKSAPLKFTTHIAYDLDPKNLKTLVANAASKGGFSLMALSGVKEPIYEERFESTCRMKSLTP